LPDNFQIIGGVVQRGEQVGDFAGDGFWQSGHVLFSTVLAGLNGLKVKRLGHFLVINNAAF
jgi:hypothetical protein